MIWNYGSIDIYDQLLKPIDSERLENYIIFMKIIQQSKRYSHLPRKSLEKRSTKNLNGWHIVY